jgi:hypothetical protein
VANSGYGERNKQKEVIGHHLIAKMNNTILF